MLYYTGGYTYGAGTLMNAMIAIALILQPHFVRLTRAAVMSEKNRDYVTAARVAGAGVRTGLPAYRT